MILIKMRKFSHYKVIVLLFNTFLEIFASTHWVVTEYGKIQPQLDSVYHMRRPYDLLSLLEQEKRGEEIERLYQEMIDRKARIDGEWSTLESATELETRLYLTDEDCLRAGKPLSDTDLYISVGEDASGRDDIDLDELLPREVPQDTPERPDCATLYDLEFSMRTFPHLQALSWNLTIEPEALEDARLLSEGVGEQIAAGLRRNHTSWFLHNLASLYWRTQGDAWRGLQCAKRAVHLSPRHFRDVALLNLGSLVQQARCPAEAAIILHAAVDHAPHIATSHYTLANVYAILGDYNRSIACYDNALKLHKNWSAAERNRFAVLCHHKLENSLYQLHRSLQGILGQLHDYHRLQEQWLKHQEQQMYQQAPLEVKLQGYQHDPISAMLAHTGEKCVPQLQDGNTVLDCENKLLAHHMQIDITMSLQMLLKNVESQAQKITEQMSRRLASVGGLDMSKRAEEFSAQLPEMEPEADDNDGVLEMFVDTELAESEGIVDRTDSEAEQEVRGRNRGIDLQQSVINFIEDLMKSQHIAQKRSVSRQQCSSSNFNTDGCNEDLNHWLQPNTVEDEARQTVLPVAQSLGLMEEGGWLQNTSSHVIATLIITCIQLSQWDASEIFSKKEQPQCSNVPGPLADLSVDSFRLMSPEPRLKTVFPTHLVGEDVSSHLSFALKDSTRHEPSRAWLLETAAALYWRLVGDTHHMISCLQAAVHKAPPHLKDIPLHHVAHILLTLGHRHEALVLASLALKVSPRSINAHMVLFHTYLAMGEPENALKYEEASIALYQQSQSGTSP